MNNNKFEIQMDHLNLARQPDLMIVKKIQPNFAVQTHHRVNLKEGEKRDRYQDLTRELKNYGI